MGELGRSIDSEMMNESSSSSASNCSHLFVGHGICLACKTKVSCVEGQPFGYLFPGLCLSREAVSVTKHLTTLISVYGHRKLHLVLDLDRTLIHSMKTTNLTKAEKYLIKEEKSGSRKDLRTYDGRLIIKLRPFVEEFLKEANKLFTMFAYTKGRSSYGHAVVRMIDPNKIYFGDRVITREESPGTKTLDLVLADERGIVIVDDKLDAWPHHQRNLLEVTKYFYFRNDHKYTKPSYAERKSDESRSKRVLMNLLKFLKQVHNGFFTCGLEDELDFKDVRCLIKGPFKPPGC
ncbi:PREDICTED: RNA polymerase II C-terminal domain phosphatase-like 4 [Camelina sativa]|uniref:RNA polymerase II C-terminal domain phosphatase-like n=1 Tax=Camelina sativa TaxID=90675 RepID=A0ABM1RP34_CAMSA|nr:PREDICTED: RNA polymerase II C-terminal domain phosphatase-like 4 [Camelina sativa]